MKVVCKCGFVMSDSGSPNDMEHLLISDRQVEVLQDLVDSEVAADGEVQMWPEHWEESGATEILKCEQCGRLHVIGSDGRVSHVYIRDPDTEP